MRAIHVSLSIICFAILSENIHYLKALDFVLDKKNKTAVASFIFCSFQYADMQVKSKDLHSLLTLYSICI